MAARNSLEVYRSKRKFSQTPEPEGSDAKTAPGHLYVIQKHAARRLHFDFRLEHRGVLLSWAVTKGPSLDPAQKRLAVRTEDHPVEYGAFEGIIPSGYGAGTVLLWDTGHWEAEGDIDAGLEKGVLKFTLHGARLRGRWALVRMKPKRKTDRENWLLIKERDEHTSTETDPVESWTESVTTGRDMEGVAKGRASTRKTSLPAFVAPQLASPADAPPAGADWIHEVKYDGYRIQALIAGREVRLMTRNGHDWTDRYPAIAEALGALGARSAVVDGEMVVLDETGRSRFSRLAEGSAGGLTYFGFDLLELDGASLRSQPLHTRKDHLRKLIPASKGVLRYSEHIEGEGAEVVQAACRMDLEGIISKRQAAPYRSGRQKSWLKSKCIGRDEFVIGGYRRSDKSGRPFASLLIGDYDGERLVYRGRVGTGFTEADLDRLAARMKPLTQKSSPFAALPADARREAVWIEPLLVAEISYPEKTQAGHLRHPSFLGLREDKPASQVAGPSRKKVKTRTGINPGKEDKEKSLSVAGVKITHAGRVVFPEAGFTKADVAQWYAKAASQILPWLTNRPVSLLRCPDGIAGECFFQKHAGQLPKTIGRVPILEKSGATADYLVISDRTGLVQAAQMGMIELHGWGARADRIERPDRMIFDLDPDPAIGFDEVRRGAEEIRQILAQAGLTSFPMVTGGKGVHVVVPLERRQTWDDVGSVSRGIARSLAGAAPDRYVATASLEKRKGRIFIDWLRNRRGATAVAPFSLRARTSAAIAAPVSWQELDSLTRADVFTPDQAPGRLTQDPWKDFNGLRQSLSRAMVSVFGEF